MEIKMNLKNQNILITGAGRGLGRALALDAIRHGANVAAVARTESELLSLKKESEALGGRLFTFVADVSRKDEIHRIVGAATAALGSINVLVNNASALGALPLASLLNTECENFETVLQTNLLGPFRLTKAVMGQMKLRNSGFIINISSDAAVEAYSHWGSYGVSKAALDHLSRIWAEEEHAVTFLSIDPGEMDTKMHADAIPEADKSSLGKPEVVARRINSLIAAKGFPSGARLKASELEDLL